MEVADNDLQLEAFCVFKKDDTQLLLRNYGNRQPEDLMMLLEMGLDHFDEQLDNCLKNTQQFDGSLGLLCKKESSFLYGKALPNGVKIILVIQSTSGAQPNPSQLDAPFKMLIKIYLRHVNNPFYSVGTPLIVSDDDSSCPGASLLHSSVK